MQIRNFFIHLRFISTVFKQKYLKIGGTHQGQYAFEWFFYEEGSLKKKDSVSFYFARDIGEKCDNKQNHPVKNDSSFT